MNNFESYKTYMSIIFLELLLRVNASEILKQNRVSEGDYGDPVCKQFGNHTHCYFLVKCTLQDDWSIQDLVSKCKNHGIVLSTADECFKIPLVSGVAIDTSDELQFVQDLIISSDEPQLQAFTSGFWSCKSKMEHPNIQDFCGVWQEWDSPITEEILDFRTCTNLFNGYQCPSNNQTVYYVLQKSLGSVYWNFIADVINETENIRRNPKNKTQETVYVACEYEIVGHEKCSTTTAKTSTSVSPDGIETSETSEMTTATEQTRSSTTGGNNEVDTSNTSDMTTATEYAGSSTSGGTEVVDTSETSEITTVTEYIGSSTSTGTYIVETSATSEIIMETQYTISPEEVTSTETNSGQFTTEESCTLCQKIDDYGSEWIGCSGEVVYRSCPYDAYGNASWSCGRDGFFAGDMPDYLNCHNSWIADLQEMVGQQVAAEEIIEHFLWDSFEEYFFGHEISQLVEILFNTSKLLQKEACNYNETYKAEVYKTLVPKLANITNNIMREEKPWKQINEVSKALGGSKLQDFLYQIGFTLIDAIFARDKQNQFNIEYSYSNLKLGMQLSSPTESTDQLVINYPKNSMDKVGSIAVYGELSLESGNSPALIASVGTIIDSKTGKQLYPEKMKSWPETTEMLLNSAVISFEFQGLSQNKMEFNKRETKIKPLKIESVIITHVHSISARGPSKQLIRRKLFPGETPTAVLGHAKCVFWDNSSHFGRWDESGCKMISTNESLTRCYCSHLSSFGVFMSIHKYESKGFAMELLSWICSGLSIICLILTLAVFHLFKANLQGERETICRNISSCLLVTHILSLTVLDKTYFNLSDASCSCVGAILHYILSSGFLWMAAEGHHLYRLIVRVMDGTGKDCRKRYYIMSYGLSLTVVGLTAMIGFMKGERAYGNPELCWLSLPNYQWSFISQALLIPLVNIIVLVQALRAAVSVGPRSCSKKLGIWLRGWFTLSSLLGVTWFIGIATFNLNVYFEYIFVTLNGLQGVMIFVSRILRNEQVWSLVVRRLRKRALLKSFYLNTISENSSSTQMKSSRNFRNRGGSRSQLWNVEEEANSSTFQGNQSHGNNIASGGS